MAETGPEQKAHRITWWVYAAPRERIRRTAIMRGTWDYDVTCTCGWDSRTGGALERHVRDLVEDHRRDVHWDAERAAAAAGSVT